MAAASTLSSLPSFPLSHPQFLNPNHNLSLRFPKPSLLNFKLASSHSSFPLPDDPFFTGRFLSAEEHSKLNLLHSFLYTHQLRSGSLWIRVMRPHEMDLTVHLLADSFAESMVLPTAYANVLRFLVKQYLMERRTLMPHMATLVAFYKGAMLVDNDSDTHNSDEEEKNEEEEKEEEKLQLAGTVEICFDKRGANASVPSPSPPIDSPYISNMAVLKSLRRRGIGWHLLKASEELISQMGSSKEVYLHCRMIDTAPFNMYTKADYKIVKTDSVLVLLMLQRRKHLMCKKLPLLSTPSETESFSDM